MKRIFDALAIGTISAALNIAAGGSWFSWLSSTCPRRGTFFKNLAITP